MIMAFLTAGLFEWAKLFIEGADDALNKGYKHHSVQVGNSTRQEKHCRTKGSA